MDATDFLNLQEDFAGAPVPLEALQREVPWKVPTDIDNNNNNNNNNNDDDFDDDALKALAAREDKRARLWAAHEKRFKQKFPRARADTPPSDDEDEA